MLKAVVDSCYLRSFPKLRPTLFLFAAGLVVQTIASGFAQELVAPLGGDPYIVAHPTNRVASPGQNVTFSVTAGGTPPFRYQWRLNGVNFPGATNSTLTLNNVQPRNGGSYSVTVSGPGGVANSQTATLLVSAQSGSFTDAFGAGTPVDIEDGVRATNNVNATRQFGEPNHAGKPGGKSMWLRWLSPISGVVTFDTQGSSFDTLLAAYTGNSVTNLSHVASDDDRGGFLTSRITFNADLDATYHIVVDGFAGDSGNVVLNWSGEFGPFVPVIVSGPSNLVVRAGSNVTYRVVATDFPSSFQWYFNGNEMPGETGDELQLTNVQQQHVGSYWVRAFSFSTAEVADSKAVRLEMASTPRAVSVEKVEELFPPPPSFVGFGDKFTRDLVSVSAGTIDSQIINNTTSTAQRGEPNHCGALGGASRWFALENANASPMTFIIDTRGSAINTILAVYNGADTLTLQLLTCAAGPGSDSQVMFEAAPFGKYTVAVDGLNGAQGIIHLNWRLGRLPVFTQQPVSRTVRAGEHYTNVIAVTGLPTPALQWMSNNASVFRGTNTTLTVSNALRSAVFHATASNFMGTAQSANAMVAVAHPFTIQAQRVSTTNGDALRLGGLMSTTPNATNSFVVQATTNLYQWTSIFTNRVPVASTNFIDPDRGSFRHRFYRVIPFPPY
jgi:hypothetical protein